MKLSLFKLAILCVLILTTTAYSQHQGLSYNFFGGGARSEGMGQAYLAISDDGAAGGWNPAGLYVHEKTLFGFSYSFFMPRGHYKFFETPNVSQTYDHTGTIGFINNGSLIFPIRIKNHHFVLNLTWARLFDTYYEFGEKLYSWSDPDRDDPSVADDDSRNAFMKRKGGINALNLGFGTRIYKELSFGLTGKIYWGQVVTNEDRYIFLDTSAYEGGDALVEIYSGSLDSTSYTGFNLNAGFLYATDKFRAGLMFRAPFVLRGDSDSTLTRWATINGIPYNATGTVLSSDTIYIDNMTSRLEMPLMVGFGLGYYINDNWLVAADLEYKAFDGKTVENLDSLNLTATGDKVEYYSSTDSVPNWNNVIQFRFGTEYLLNTSIGEIPIRFGFRNEAFPQGNIVRYDISYEGEKQAGGAVHYDETSYEGSRVYYQFYYDTEKITGFSFSLGTGIHWSQVMLDVAYTYTTYEQKIYSGADNLRSKNEWKNHHLNFSFTGYF